MSDKENFERSDLEWQMLLKSIPTQQIQEFIDDMNGVYNVKPCVFVKVSGGRVQGTVSNMPLDVTVLDYDIDGCGDDELVDIPEADGEMCAAIVYDEAPLVDEAYCEMIETAIELADDEVLAAVSPASPADIARMVNE